MLTPLSQLPSGLSRELLLYREQKSRVGQALSGCAALWHVFQRFELDPGGLTVTLGLQSLASEPFPFSLGLHPYFPHPADALLQASCHRVWSGDGTGIPTRADVIPREADFGEARAVAASMVVFGQNLIGLGLGPLLFGRLSDMLMPYYSILHTPKAQFLRIFDHI